MITVSRFAVGLLFVSSASAFFHLTCTKPVLNARVDPIVNPGQPSSHLHTIQGSGAIGPDATFADLRNSNCTTCKVMDDKSAYWAPELFFEYKNGSFQMVDHGGMVAYYLPRPNADMTPVKAFPDGFRMLAGDPYVRNYTNTPESQAFTWLCLNYDLPDEAPTPGIVNTNCKNDLRAQSVYPSCWDGKNLDSPDHKSHVAYPDGIDHGECPPTHPVRLVTLFTELWYYTQQFANDDGRFVLSTGDPTGFSLHGDFMNGWDNEILQNALDTCTSSTSGDLSECGVLSGRLYTDAENNACSAPDPYPQESVMEGQLLPYLPGCVAVTEGPEPASPAALVPGCQALGVGGTGNGTATPSGVPTSLVPPASMSASSSIPNPMAPSASLSPSSGVPTTKALPASMSPSSSVPNPMAPSASLNPSSGVPTTTAPSGCHCDCSSPSLVPQSSDVPTSPSSKDPVRTSLTTPMSSSLPPTMAPTDSPSGSQVSSSPVLAASPTTTHDHASGGCGEHSASPTTTGSMMARRSRHHMRRGHDF